MFFAIGQVVTPESQKNDSLFHPICGFLKMNVFFLNGSMPAFRKECSVISWTTGRGGLAAEWRKLSSCLPCTFSRCCSVAQLCPILQSHGLQHARLPCPSPSPGVCSLMAAELVMPSNHLILCCPLLFLPSIFPSIRVFSNESVLHIRWPKYWSFSFSISPSNEYSGLISFRMDWFDLAVQGTLKSLLPHHSSKASILWCSAFFRVQLSHPYMTAGKTIALTRQTFVSKVMSLLSNTLCFQ